MKRPIHTYTLNPGAGTLDLSGIAGFDIRNLFAVIHLPSGGLIYAPTALQGYSALNGGVLTLKVPVSAMSAADPLLVLYDDGGKPAEDTSVQAVLTQLKTKLSVSIDGDSVVLNNTGLALETGGNLAALAGTVANGTLKVAQTDVTASGTIAAATNNATYVVAIANAEGVVGFNIAGLTASGAVLTAEAVNGAGTTWSSINTIQPGTGVLSTTVAADGNYRVNAGGHAQVRLRVSTVGTGTINVTTTTSSQNPLVALSAPANVMPTAGTMTQTVVALAAGVAKVLLAPGTYKDVRFSATGLNPYTVAPGIDLSVTVGGGINYAGAAAAGQPGGGETFTGLAIPTNGLQAIAAAATSVTVWTMQ